MALTSNTTDRRIVEKAKRGDCDAFQQLYDMHKRRVFALCVRMLRSPEQAEDLMQETFLQVYRKLHTFRGESAFTTWLHRVAVNKILMYLRDKSLPEISLEEWGNPTEWDGSSRRDGPQKELSARDQTLHGTTDRVDLERAIGQLPPGYRMIFVLHEIEGYEHHEIAEIFDCSIGNSKSQLHKARMKVRVLLQAGATRLCTAA